MSAPLRRFRLACTAALAFACLLGPLRASAEPARSALVVSFTPGIMAIFGDNMYGHSDAVGMGVGPFGGYWLGGSVGARFLPHWSALASGGWGPSGSNEDSDIKDNKVQVRKSSWSVIGEGRFHFFEPGGADLWLGAYAGLAAMRESAVGPLFDTSATQRALVVGGSGGADWRVNDAISLGFELHVGREDMNTSPPVLSGYRVQGQTGGTYDAYATRYGLLMPITMSAALRWRALTW